MKIHLRAIKASMVRPWHHLANPLRPNRISVANSHQTHGLIAENKWRNSPRPSEVYLSHQYVTEDVSRELLCRILQIRRYLPIGDPELGRGTGLPFSGRLHTGHLKFSNRKIESTLYPYVMMKNRKRPGPPGCFRRPGGSETAMRHA